ncbi:MAG: TonB-dependent receptor plug domain-containing protein, partial [Pseudomonadota bacterium]|nr:TonB-dependent receptor plug domain-containing protein [Pseudomonadota bacterium]MEC8797891.1 TonB-dependent receptor plug domain-containing protein [Pseudomonadota bacterium]
MSKLLKRCLLVSTAIFSVFFLSNLSVKAQETNENISPVEEIIVTGSRIKGINPDSFAPVGIISQEDILLSGKISIGEILLELPGQGSGINRNYNNGGDGSVKVDFRNLSSSRTLVLVDGRRWVNGGEGANAAVDLNTIPTSSIERVEVLKDGASAVYGSDAIAAVVNIITKDNFDGLNASFQRGEYFDGGGMADSYDLSLGVESDKGSILLGASYVDIKALGNGDRPQTAARPSFGGSAGTPQGRLAYGGVVGDCS